MLKNMAKKAFAVTAAAALLAFGLTAPGSAATGDSTKTYTYFYWYGYKVQLPAYFQLESVQPVQPIPSTPAEHTSDKQLTNTTEPTASVAEPASNNETIAFSEVQQVVNLVNAEREKANLAPLKVNTELADMAKVKAEDMRDNSYFSHTSPTYGSPFDMMKSFGIAYSYAGENIAAGQKTPEEVFNAWMNSPGHKANILSKDFSEIGVGLAKGGSYGTYWVQEFISP